jgi:hypothetical protein
VWTQENIWTDAGLCLGLFFSDLGVFLGVFGCFQGVFQGYLGIIPIFL